MGATATRLSVIPDLASAPDPGRSNQSTHATHATTFCPPRSAVHFQMIRDSELFKGMTLSEELDVLALAREHTFEVRQALSRGGETARFVGLLVTGRMKVVQRTADGGEAILRIAHAGQIVGVLSLYKPGGETHTIEAMEVSRALLWDVTNFARIVERYPRVLHNMIALIGAQLHEIEERFCELATAKVPTRVARTVSRLCQRGAVHSDDGTLIRLSREQIALLAGTSMFAVSRLFSEWERKGVLRSMRQAILVVNPQALNELTETA